MYRQTKYTGLNSEGGGFWGWCKRAVKSKAFKIGMGFLTGGVAGAITATLLAFTLGGVYAPGTYQIIDNYQPKNEAERQAAIFWNENLYIPFILRIEALITGTNQQKNRALILMGIYEKMLNQQLIDTKEDAKFFLINNMSYDCLMHRYAYVLDIHNNIRSMLTIAPSQKTIININTYLQEFTNIFNQPTYTETKHLPNQVEVLLLNENTQPVDVDLNIPTEKDKTENLTTKTITPITADGKNIAEAITSVIKTKETDQVEVRITGNTKTDTNSKEVVTITETINTDGTKTQEVIAEEINNANGTTQTKETISTTKPTTEPTKSSLVATFQQAVIFTGVAVVANKLFKTK